MKNKVALLFLALASFAPVVWRLASQHVSEPIGLLSDCGLGLLLLLLALYSPHWLRVILVSFWALFQAIAHELVAAMQRLPTWQDLHYLTDPAFVENSTAGFNLSSPYLVGMLVISALVACVLPVQRPAWGLLRKGLAVSVCLMLAQGFFSRAYDNQSVIARYNPLQWFVVDAFSTPLIDGTAKTTASLPKGLNELDLSGNTLTAKGKAKNVLLVVLEGIPGMYYPEIGKTIGTQSKEVSMNKLADSTPDAMLIPNFVVHSHQTIRGLYSMLCGDFSKQSWDTPKAFELQQDPARAQDCLPAQMAKNGWSTHYLQAAGLGFMGKDRVMPMIGFQQVHGNEWFTEPNPYPFEWGVTDEIFFRGAGTYIADLQAKKQPWMLTLLTVGTHQPYAVPDDIAARYPSRRIATVALLDQAVATFIDKLRTTGVLDDTLVIVTSDESHGSDIADWISSWGLGVVLAPEQPLLPRIKKGEYGLVDITGSVLDYFGLQQPSTLIGRSFFREYTTPREMVSYTTSKRRWLTADNLRYECSDDGRCRVGKAESLLGAPPADFMQDKEGRGAQIFTIASTLDHKLLSAQGSRVLKFANGELRKLPEKIISEWGDNLVGAQYLDFPADSKVHVTIRVKAIEAPAHGIQLKLSLKQWEHALKDIALPEFPVLHAGQEGSVEFDFDNPEARQSFSFHLVGEGKDAVIQLDEFNVTVDTDRG